MSSLRAVPHRRHDPHLQNFVFKGQSDPAARRKDEAEVDRLARKVRQARAASAPSGSERPLS